jgi:glycerol-3-phosphate acyltransferase PlsY
MALFDNLAMSHKVIGLMVFSYLMGSISFAYLIGRLKGIDLRQHGSKNVGATNAGRVLGRKYFIIVFLLDALKGFVPTFLAGQILFHPDVNQSVSFMLWLAAAFCAIAGHNWPCWLKFKGGKGVSTSLGVVLAIYPYFTFPGLLGLATWIILVKISGYVSLGSIIASAMFAISYFVLLLIVPSWKLADQWVLLTFATLMSGLLIFRHSGNIQRLRQGTENKFSLR